MKVSLTPELAQFVKDQVARGNFASASAVVRDGLRLLQAYAGNEADVEALRQAVGQGLEQAQRGETTDGTEVFTDKRARRRQARANTRNLKLSQAVAARLRIDPSHLPRTLTALEAQLAAEPVVERGLLEQWRTLIERAITGDAAPLYEALEAKNEEAARLRQASPFSGVLSKSERWVLLADARARAQLGGLFIGAQRRLAASLTLPPELAQQLGPEASDDAFLDAAVELVARDEADDVTRSNPRVLTATENRALVYTQAVEVLGSPEKADRWLRTPQLALGGLTPEAVLRTDKGTADVLQMLGRIDHGILG